MITSVRHVGINVVNLKRSVNFYKKFGFKIIYAQKEEWDSILYIVKMELGGFVLELVYDKNKTELVNQSVHLCFGVSSLFDLHYTFLNDLKEDVSIVLGPIESPTKKTNVMFIRDFNNLTLEISELK